MRFAFALYRYFPYSGLARDFLRILLEAQSRGHEIDVYVSRWEGDRPQGVDINELHAQALTNHSRNVVFHRLFMQAIEGQHYDAIVGFNKMPGLDIYYGADYCYVARAKPNYAPVYRLTPRYSHQHQFERGVFHSGSKTMILSLSEREKSVYQQHYGTPESRFVLMPPTLDKSRKLSGDADQTRIDKRKALKLRENDCLLLFIGSGFKTKGLDRANLALDALPEKIKQCTQLFVVGQDSMQHFKRQADALGLQDKVLFLGGRTDVPELMLAGDLLIHPAYSENTGTVILEAIISGLPVIATDVCGYAPHIDIADAGQVLRSPFSQAKLNQLLPDMLVSPHRKQWRANGRAYGVDPSLYQMPETAVDTIEAWVTRQQETAHLSTVELPEGQSIYLSPALQSAFPDLQDMSTVMRTNGEIIREAPGRRTVLFSHDDRCYYLKAHTGVGWREIAKNLSYLKVPVIGAQNEWHGIHHLTRLGVDTLNAVGYGIQSGNPARQHSFIISEALENTISLDVFCGRWRDSPPTTAAEIRFKRWLIRRLAEMARDIHNSGANHRDFYLIHFLLELGYADGELDGGASKVSVIDLHRMQIRKRTPLRWVVKDIAGLYFSSMGMGLSQRDYYRFMQVYSSTNLRQIINHDLSFWLRVKRVGQKVYTQEERRKVRNQLPPAVNL